MNPSPGGADRTGARRAGVVGRPVGHSLSPRLHRAAFAVLGLDGWTFEATDVPAGGLADHVAGLGPEWVGLAVTMPLKREALELPGAVEVGQDARLAGGANTLLRRGSRWAVDNTDVAGLGAAMAGAGVRAPRRATVLGAGATARSALVALARAGAGEVVLAVRDRVRAETMVLVDELGLSAEVLRLGQERLVLDPAAGEVVVSTLPAGADVSGVLVPDVASAPVVLDVAYAPWPSGFAAAVDRASGGRLAVVRGTEMLLHQAVRQVELMTGHDGPVEAMRAALAGEAG
ncbi:shikimate dehydrogenase [Ornithinimicrobium avium]|uniref:Shikimate dehydrogenase n=1 Tax=Ornithinimicrobium avium TaxID=2283195 RepID=A0A345NS22_9MICO|nr:shikimate dehydrogenase [Ornithinimicrobium avium]